MLNDGDTYDVSLALPPRESTNVSCELVLFGAVVNALKSQTGPNGIGVLPGAGVAMPFAMIG